MSGAGKSLLATALCRIFLQDGWRVSPFKSQNMSLNSYVTPDGLEIGRAQAVQAEAAGRDCDVRMNPILLKPSSHTGSQLIVMGEVRGQYEAAEYFQMKKKLIPEILQAYTGLAAENDIMVIEGAGSPAEINLRDNDIVNMGFAELIDAPVLLVGDIDRGGVFAQLYGTVALLTEKERERIIGLVINKFRGDAALLRTGIDEIEKLTGIPVLGVVPWTKAHIDDEDSLAPCLQRIKKQEQTLDVAVIRLPQISNFTDFSPLEGHPAFSVRYVFRSEDLGRPDLVCLPGTKNTIADLIWLRSTGLANAILALAGEEIPVFGICGGYQMLGYTIADPLSVEGGGIREGLGLLPCETVFTSGKTRTRKSAVITEGSFQGAKLEGYEIHMGRTQRLGGRAFCHFSTGEEDGVQEGNVYGTYLHGVFDTGELVQPLAELLAKRKGLEIEEWKAEPRSSYRQRQYDLLADEVRSSLDVNAIVRAMEAYDHA